MERDTTLGLFIRTEREKKGLTVGRAAELAGGSRKYWTQMESGANITVGVLRRAAAALDLTSIPIGGKAQLVRTQALVDAGALLDITETLAARLGDASQQIERLRDLAVSGLMGDPLTETESVRAVFSKYPDLSEEQIKALTHTARRMTKDATRPQPAISATSREEAVAKTRRKA